MGFVSFSEGKYRIIVQGMPICADKSSLPDALRAAAQMKVTVDEVAWNGDRGEWVTLSTMEENNGH